MHLYLSSYTVDKHCSNGGKECGDSVKSYDPIRYDDKEQRLQQRQGEFAGHLRAVVGGEAVPPCGPLFVDDHSLHGNYPQIFLIRFMSKAKKLHATLYEYLFMGTVIRNIV